MKKIPGEIFILHKCTINDNHLIYGSWDINCNRHIFFCHLGPFLALTAQKMKFQKNEKNTWRSSFYTSVPKIIIICYFSWDMACDGCNCYFSFWAIFCPSTSLTAQKIKISRKSKKVLEISSSYTCVPKIMIRWCSVPEIRCMTHRWTDIQMDRGTEKVTYRGGCPT